MIVRTLLPLAVALLLAACAPDAPPPAAVPAASAPSASAATAPPAVDPSAAANATCDAAKAGWAIGQRLDELLLERARVESGARLARSLKPGQMVTMEFNAERLNVDVDADGTVTGVRCG